MTSTLDRRLLSFLERHPTLLPRGGKILIALSGGPDSMALLSLLVEIGGEHPLVLTAAHFDHGYRRESETEARQVASWAACLGVPCAVGRSPTPLQPSQAAFRHARYEFLQREASRLAADRIATGHQADDQAETVLFRLVRGTGLKGLGGIPLRRGIIVRPLLPFWRSEIHGWLKYRAIDYLRDPSNEDPRWARARLRHEVIPALEALGGPSVKPRLVELADEARRADRALDRVTARWIRVATRSGHPYRFDRTVLCELDSEVLGRIVRMVAEQHGEVLTGGGTGAAVEFIKRGRSGAAIDLSGSLRLGREFDALWFGPAETAEPDRTVMIEDSTTGASRVVVGGRGYDVSWGTETPEARHPNGAQGVTVSRRRVRFPLTVRGPRPGDRITLSGGTRKLKKLFGERRVPRSERGRTPVLQGGNGRILWVAGLATARGAAAGADERGLAVLLRETSAGVQENERSDGTETRG